MKIKEGDLHYISGSDNSNAVLVTTPLNDPNYQTWVVEFRRALSTKNKVGFLDDTHKKPKSPEDNYTIP